jgi:hypothetical protein
MNCENHPEVPAAAYCRTCGKPVCDACRRDAFGTVFCAEHMPAPAAAAPPVNPIPPPGYSASVVMPPPPGARPVYADVSPPLALLLGLIPGVGAIYNGQYAKGLVHAIIWGILMSMANSEAARGFEPMFGMLVAAWWAYMAFEAYHTARRRRAGEAVDEYSSLLDLHGRKSQAPVAGIVLILLGVLMLLHTLGWLDMEYVRRWWPALLIVAGAFLLWTRFSGHDEATEEMRHER